MSLDLTGMGALFDFGSKIIDKIFPDKDKADQAKLAMMQMAQSGEFKEMELQYKNADNQLEVNKEEAKQTGLLNHWRPAIGWVCVSAYAYNFVVGPIMFWIVKLFIPDAPPLVALELGELGVILLGMLGIGGMRSYDKKIGKAS